MKRKTRLSIGLIVLIFLMLTLACSNKALQESPDNPRIVTVATGGTAGTYYPIGAAITAIITKYVPGIEAIAESTGASVTNLILISEKKIDFILGAANTTLSAYKGEPPFEKPVDNVRGITSLYPETFQFLVLKDSGLQTFYDLKGKRVVVGAPGSGTERTSKLLLEAHGITYEDIQTEFLSFAEGVNALREGTIDCAIVGSGIPTSAVVDISAVLDIGLLSIDTKAFNKIARKNPDLTVVTIPEGTYKGVNKDITTVASPALFSTHKDMEEEVVYQITSKIFSHLDEISSAHPQGRNVSLENALLGMSIQLHPGAERYYKERGLLK